MQKNFYLVVESYQNWLKTKENKFTEKAFKDNQSRNIIRHLNPNDELVFYISSGISSFAGIVKIASQLYRRSELFWDDYYNLRFQTKPKIILEESKFIDITKLFKRLSFIKNKRKRKWGNYVLHSIRKLNKKDFAIIENEIKKAKKGKFQIIPSAKLNIMKRHGYGLKFQK